MKTRVSRVLYSILNLWCYDCDKVIWFWQKRCRYSHTVCQHQKMCADYKRNVDWGIGPTQMWLCNWCGERPVCGF